MSSIFVIAYPAPYAPVVAPGVLYLRQRPSEGSVAIGGLEDNTHSIGRYSPTQHRWLRYGSWDTSQSALTTQPPEETHFVGRYSVPPLKLLKQLIQNPDTSVSSLVTQPETNTHFVGRYAPGRYPILRKLFQTTGDSPPLGVQIEAGPHFVGRYSPASLRLLRSLIWHQSEFDIPFVPPQDTNPHFVGRYFVPPYKRVFRFSHQVEGPAGWVKDIEIANQWAKSADGAGGWTKQGDTTTGWGRVGDVPLPFTDRDIPQ